MEKEAVRYSWAGWGQKLGVAINENVTHEPV